jgi:hypothetical protein
VSSATGSRGFVVFTTVDAILLVAVGVISSQTTGWTLLAALAGLIALLIIVRILLAAPARVRGAEDTLTRLYGQRPTVLNHLQHVLNLDPDRSLWTAEAFSEFYWLWITDYVWTWEFEASLGRPKGFRIRRHEPWHKRIIRWFRSRPRLLMRNAEGLVTSNPDFVPAVELVGYGRSAEIILASAVEQGFLVENVERDAHSEMWNISYRFVPPRPLA